MATSNNNSSNNAFSDFVGFAQQTSQTVTSTVNHASTQVGEVLGENLYNFVEQGTETIGALIAPIANHPLIKFATKVPGMSWLLAAIGQVNVEAVQRDVAVLQRTYPLENHDELAQRVIMDTAWKAAGVGLATNFIPPIALLLLAVDVGAIAALQARMIYQIAAIYGFSPTDSARLGEVLAIWGLLTGSSSMVKAGLSGVELVPVAGTAIGTASDAALVYGLGQVARLFYEAKQKAVAEGRDRESISNNLG